LKLNAFLKKFHPFQRRKKLEEKQEKGSPKGNKGSQLGGNVHPFQNHSKSEGG